MEFTSRCDVCGREQLPANMSMCNDCATTEENTMEKCRHCNKSGELTYNTLVGDTYCALCGMWQQDEEQE